MDAGANFGAGSRRMWDGSANYIAYNINLPDNSGPWGDPGYGDTFPTGNVWTGTGTNASLPFNVRGSVTGAAPYAPGSYADQVTVSVHF
jgi:spore coat protein U-like protein